MKPSLMQKSIIGFLLFAIISFLLLNVYTQKAIFENSKQQEARALYRESAMIASRYGTAHFSRAVTLENLQQIMESVSIYLSADIQLIDTQGNLLLDSADAQTALAALDKKYRTVPDFRISYFHNSFFADGTFFGQFTEPVLSVYSPITINFKVSGYVLIHKPIASINGKAVTYANTVYRSYGLVLLSGIAILCLWLFLVYRPIRELMKVSAEYGKGDFSKQVRLLSHDEFRRISATLNYMANELNTLEEYQRKFVSNISHDFRSPLTSIKGYAEAMIDGTIPSELQPKYLNIIVFETERLNKLTQSILDLNKFGRRGMILEITDFDINQMIRKTLLTFEGTCEKKGITFNIVLTGQKLFVTADMGKIQQIIYNLIDNAIKFSHHDSSIKVETRLKNDKVFVSVKDSGIGIPADSVKKIWDRFYKTDLSRGKDKKGTGLGLSIVKEIIQAHHENINCISTEGVGTEFIFTLPLSQKEQ